MIEDQVFGNCTPASIPKDSQSGGELASLHNYAEFNVSATFQMPYHLIFFSFDPTMYLGYQV